MVETTVESYSINLSSIEKFEFCKLNLLTGKVVYFQDYKILGKFKGFYYRRPKVFFALFATKEGPMIYYNNKQYRLSPDLNISIEKKENKNIFCIEEYDIQIIYFDSNYLDMDIWSKREDVDLFYQIKKSYKDKKYYKKFTI